MSSNPGPEILSSPYLPRSEPAYGPQLVAVYFGSDTCAFCVHPAFKTAMRNLGSLLAAQAAAAGRTFHFAAVAKGWDVQKGIDHLRELGDFDEVSAGGNWHNTVISQRLFSRGRPAVPTLVLSERTITPTADSNTLIFTPERELTRLVGSRQIQEWIERGAPMADLFNSIAPILPPPAT